MRLRLSTRDRRTRQPGASLVGLVAYEAAPGVATIYPERRHGGDRKPHRRRLGVFASEVDVDGFVEVEADAAPESPTLTVSATPMTITMPTSGLVEIGEAVFTHDGQTVTCRATQGSVPVGTLVSIAADGRSAQVQVGAETTAAQVARGLRVFGNDAETSPPWRELYLEGRMAEEIRRGFMAQPPTDTFALAEYGSGLAEENHILGQDGKNTFQGWPLTEANLEVIRRMTDDSFRISRPGRDLVILPPAMADALDRLAMPKRPPGDLAVVGVEVCPEAARWLQALLPYVGETACADELAALAQAVEEAGFALLAKAGTLRVAATWTPVEGWLRVTR